jgi:hypothetical protein
MSIPRRAAGIHQCGTSLPETERGVKTVISDTLHDHMLHKHHVVVLQPAGNDAFKKHNKNDMDWKETQLKYLDRITSLGKKMAAAHGHLYSITKKYEQVVFDAFETLTANIDKENKVTVMIENIHEN